MVYRLFFSNDTMFTRNRVYLLASIAIAFVAPFIAIPLISNTITINALPIIVATTVGEQASSSYNSYLQIVSNTLIVVYCLGVLFMLIRSYIAYNKVINIIRKAKKQTFGEIEFLVSVNAQSPFSIWKWIILPEKYTSHQEIEKIVRHELIHCRQYHSVDLVLVEMLVIVQWFNPFAWFLKSTVIQNNEYNVDKQLLNNGVERRSYQYLLLQTTIGESNLAVANHFSAYLIKKRIHMMNKSDSPKWYGVKNMMILVAVLMVLALGAYLERNMHTNVIASTNTVSTPVTEKEGPIYIRDGKIISLIEMRNIDKGTIQSVKYLTGEEATALYGEKYKNGVVIYTIKPLSPLLPK
jgi:beta-lactamase regulating signal transducer with metallopeptidase domain